MCGGDVEGQLLDQPRQPWRLTFREVQHQPRQCGGVDDGVLERALEAAAHQPGIEGVVAVLNEDSAMGEPKESAASIFELRRTDEHRAVDVMAPARVWVDGGAAVDERVEKRKRPIEPETLGAHLEDQERRIARRLDVERDELRILEPGLRLHLGRVDCDFLPCHELARSARFEEERLGAHRVIAIARLAQLISSLVSARSSSTATAYTTTPTAMGIAILTPPRSRSG